ncbi:hypothetical protein GIB67_027386 [Kingdonia uniflora]|uniref:Uncharacterized protein n=1 Tax=Kingdonia uniflora TaxID=39325 RepID=A0A7J7MF17_9MAGN|nr:hypothetical protein GIB67_027386 [Kingdonia uniflora]
MQCLVETSSNEDVSINSNTDLHSALEDYLAELSNKVGDVGPILDMMAMVLENIPTTTILARATILSLYRQKDIFYIAETNKEQLEKSPFLERLTKKNYEVIFFTDLVDEYLMQYLMENEDNKFQNISKEGLKLGKDSKDKEVNDTFKDLMKWWKDVLVSDNVDSMKISNRLDNSP